MIRLKQSVPSVYYDNSRDFQLISHLFDIVLNSIKTDSDRIKSLPFSEESDDQLLDLLAFTLGLKLDKSKYSSAQLRAVCSVISKVLKNKGSLTAVNLLCTALMRADGIDGKFVTKIAEDGTHLDIYISNVATCKELLNELLPYIIPAGMIFNIKQAIALPTEVADNYAMNHKVIYSHMNPDIKMLKKYNNELDVNPGRASIFVPQEDTPQLLPGLLIGASIVDTTEKSDLALLPETVDKEDNE